MKREQFINSLLDKSSNQSLAGLKGSATIDSLFPQEFKASAENDTFNPDDVLGNWLGQLKLLQGIPLNYLVPHHTLLPTESIRFFTVDMRWLQYLMRGALSIGSHTVIDGIMDSYFENKTQKHALVHSCIDIEKNTMGHLSNFLPQPEKDSLRLTNNQLMDTEVQNIAVTEITGFIMRSSFVKSWAGVKIEALDDETPCAILRSSVIGADLKLCLFEGKPNKFRFFENTGALSFGFDTVSNGTHITKNLRPKDTKPSIDGDFVESNGKVKISDLANAMNTTDAASFAYQMVQGAENFTYNLNL
jgi:hypothetical protein